jgi:CTP:phosphocholine cytidylyltransferase-like protein
VEHFNKPYKVDNAIILAAGLGSRFIPLSFEIPKGLIPLKGQPMIERQIEQLLDAGISEIIIVTGCMSEKFEYLKEKYRSIQLVYNPDYAVKNNLFSVYYARQFLKNSYILSSDNWIQDNVFHDKEEHSWYSCVYSEGPTKEWCVRTDDAGRITAVTVGGADAWYMYGPVFLSKNFTRPFKRILEQYARKPGTETLFWEDVFLQNIDKLRLFINKQSDKNIFEIETMEELRQFDSEYGYNTGNGALATICKVLHISEKDILQIRPLKSDKSGSAFSFTALGNEYMYKHPGVVIPA